MANEKRLIDANTLIAEYDRVHIGEPEKARKLIADAPTVDAVPVVRCRECKWYQIRRWNDTKAEYDCRKTNALLDVSPDDFCSYGERKEGSG